MSAIRKVTSVLLLSDAYNSLMSLSCIDRSYISYISLYCNIGLLVKFVFLGADCGCG
jgi:hypothetical protein